MTYLAVPIAAAFVALAAPALAEFQQVTQRSDFVALMSGKSLTRPLVNIQVSPDGNISGTGAAWEVTGSWRWEGGYLCRSLEWGGDDLGYNCQEVAVNGDRVRITSDRGAGRSADFRLR
ncbi:MAG: dihydrodipicolinate reductase [Sulfitobacter sp.]|nr:dihydrodipicolinate reductase [Sulfitobacter sp.]